MVTKPYDIIARILTKYFGNANVTKINDEAAPGLPSIIVLLTNGYQALVTPTNGYQMLVTSLHGYQVQ